ncbi:MAG: PSD1 and planctomycete cytochrome C domain-containing protein [Verrucomicrobiota bacterium]
MTSPRTPKLQGLLAVLSTLGLLTASHAAAEPLRFNRDIRPILSNACFRCHGPDDKKREGGLRLDLRNAAITELKSGDTAIVPGKPDESELLKRVSTHDPDDMMPPPEAKKPALTEQEVATLRDWITQGASFEDHWAFLPLGNDAPPAVKNTAWPRNGIDQFILARLEKEGIAPSSEADRHTLLRRVSLDLTGLLPTPSELDAFLADQSPDTWEKVVDRLLASPHYGERWGRHWLDQARYADSNGYSIDGERVMWPFRDWVINALNNDAPFDQFTIEQLAGDLLPNPAKAQLAATAFHRNTVINDEGGVDAEQVRVETSMDRAATTSAVWLGLTVACAQCHTHKYDPITHKDYYGFHAFFNTAQDANNKGPTVDIARGELLPGAPPESAGTGPEAETEPDTEARADPKTGARAKAKMKPRPAALMIMREQPTPRDTFLLTRGDFTRPDTAAGPLLPAVLPAVPPKLEKGTGPDGRLTRLDLAKWLVSPENPLTPRVTVNRIWMRYFGRGLVETEDDFGTQGSAPTHPELLDWLARGFMDNGWSQKKLHRLIVTSATYRQASEIRPDLQEKDPRNLLLARQERLRVEAEIVRDAALCSSGLLNPEMGGPSVRPPQPEGVYSFTQRAKKWETSPGGQRYRRGLYTFLYRSAPYPLFGTFDAPDFSTVCTRRPRSDTPLQSLTLANDPAFLDMASKLAARMATEVPGAFDAVLDARLKRGFLLTLSRNPSPGELSALRAYTAGALTDFTGDEPAARSLAKDFPPAPAAPALPPAEAAALVCAARVLLNTDNFITRE